jgi:hypothetical protein
VRVSGFFALDLSAELHDLLLVLLPSVALPSALVFVAVSDAAASCGSGHSTI